MDVEGYIAAAKCLADDLDALVAHLRYRRRLRRRWRAASTSSTANASSE
jgi:hypothetical protein